MMKFLYVLLLVSSSAIAANPNIWLVAEHHEHKVYRDAFNEMLRDQPQMDCVFLEDSPEMNDAAQAFIRGEGSFEDTYLKKYFDVGIQMGFTRESLQGIWNENYAGREKILKTAKDRGLKVFHVDYSSTESNGFVRLTDDSSVIWNYERRHEIMTRNIYARRNECEDSMYLVGESHVDTQRILSLLESPDLVTRECYKYGGPQLRSLENYLQDAGFNTRSINVVIDRSQRNQFSVSETASLTPQASRALQDQELATSNGNYLLRHLPVNLSAYDQVYTYNGSVD